MLSPIFNDRIRNIHSDFPIHNDVKFVSLLAVGYNIFTCIIDLILKHFGDFLDHFWVVFEKLDLFNYLD